MNKSLWSGMLFVPDNALIGYPNVGQRWGCCPTYFGFSNTSRCLTLKKPPALFTGPGGFFMNTSSWSGMLFVSDNPNHRLSQCRATMELLPDLLWLLFCGNCALIDGSVQLRGNF